MGSQESKPEQPQKEEGKETLSIQDSAPSSPILTPLDPRSPSANVARTPLEAVLGIKPLESTVDTKTENGGTKELVNVILGIDPRSPTVEFNRTPIIVGAIAKDKLPKLQNKNLENIRKLEIQTTPVSVAKNPNCVPPKLLEVSPTSIISNYNKRKSFVGLLETNIDFRETDLDTVAQIKADFNKSLPAEIVDDVPYNQLKEQVEALQLQEPCKEACEALEQHAQGEEEKNVELTAEKILDEKSVNITAQVKEFDKKLTTLIYEDTEAGDLKINSRVTKLKENNRTPLGIRNSIDDPKKVNKLKVSDKPRKSESKIPVFKDNYYKKVVVQCENTPPRKLDEIQCRHKISHWDAEKSLII